ncbi:alpha/beta fold hydrolase [Nonomuraea sp. NPDC005692]|uniref:alpha/beta fold hydrolase n=1 Tax=Nonomuraea sp. NPDC005692 TaxID=3157168 RepID=UPI0033D8512F
MIIRVVLALALSVPLVTRDTPPPVEAAPCPVAVPEHTVCGFLLVPERRDAPGRTIKVGYAVHTSTAPGRRPDPIVYMGGGPASSSLQLTGFLSQMFPDRDVVTIEQRGGKYSRPVLGCPETAEALLGRLRRPPADVGAAARRCRARLQEQGIDLRGYNTKEIAADVVALRQALGHPSWNLFGVSYSTRVMTDVAAADPQGVRSVVLDSFLPESVAWYDDADRNLRDTMAALGAGDAFDRLVARLNRSPARVPTTDPLLGRPFTATMSGDDVATVLAEALHEADVSAVAPALVGGLAEGHDELLRPLADAVGEGLVSHEFGLYHAVQCQDEVPFNTFTTRSRLFTVNGDKAVCDAWQLPKSAPVNAVPETPVYVVGGEQDPTTPARTAGPAARAIPGARFETFRGSHAVFLSSACARKHIAEFVEAPGRVPPKPCEPDPAQPPTLRLADTHVTGAPYGISQAPWLAAPFALFVLVALVQLAAGALRGRAMTAFAGLAGVAFAGLTGQAVYGMASRNETALAVGVPGSVGGLYTWIAVASAVLSVAALFQARRWPHIVAAVAGAGFLVWWFTWFL